MRRARIPMALTNGLSPHPRLRIIPAVKLGIEARDLTCVVYLTHRMKEDVIHARLSEELPDGIDIASVDAPKTHGATR